MIILNLKLSCRELRNLLSSRKKEGVIWFHLYFSRTGFIEDLARIHLISATYYPYKTRAEVGGSAAEGCSGADRALQSAGTQEQRRAPEGTGDTRLLCRRGRARLLSSTAATRGTVRSWVSRALFWPTSTSGHSALGFAGAWPYSL